MNSQKGSAAVIAIVFMAFLGIIISGVLPMVRTEMTMGTQNKHILEARYAAERGAKRAVVEFSNSGTSWNWLTTSPYSVVITPGVPANALVNGRTANAGTYTVTSSGTVGGVTKTVTFNVVVPNNVSGNYAINSIGAIDGGNNDFVFDGSVVSGGTINNMIIEGGYSLIPNTTVPLPVVTWPTSGNSLPSAGGVISGVYYINGDYSPSQNVTFSTAQGDTAKIYINGSLGDSGQNGLTFNGDILLVVKNDISLKNNFVMNKGVVLAGGNVVFKNNATITGSLMVGGTTQFKNNATITYDANTVGSLGFPVGGPTVFSNWVTN